MHLANAYRESEEERERYSLLAVTILLKLTNHCSNEKKVIEKENSVRAVVFIREQMARVPDFSSTANCEASSLTCVCSICAESCLSFASWNAFHLFFSSCWCQSPLPPLLPLPLPPVPAVATVYADEPCTPSQARKPELSVRQKMRPWGRASCQRRTAPVRCLHSAESEWRSLTLRTWGRRGGQWPSLDAADSPTGQPTGTYWLTDWLTDWVCTSLTRAAKRMLSHWIKTRAAV